MREQGSPGMAASPRYGDDDYGQILDGVRGGGGCWRADTAAWVGLTRRDMAALQVHSDMDRSRECQRLAKRLCSRVIEIVLAGPANKLQNTHHRPAFGKLKRAVRQAEPTVPTFREPYVMGSLQQLHVIQATRTKHDCCSWSLCSWLPSPTLEYHSSSRSAVPFISSIA